MSQHKLQVLARGLRYQVFLPDGTELRRITDIKIKTAPGEPPKLVLEFADFELDAQLSSDKPSPQLLAQFGLRPEDFKDVK